MAHAIIPLTLVIHRVRWSWFRVLLSLSCALCRVSCALLLLLVLCYCPFAQVNPTGELSLLRYAFAGLIDASTALGRDVELRTQWNDTLCHLAPWNTGTREGQEVRAPSHVSLMHFGLGRLACWHDRLFC